MPPERPGKSRIASWLALADEDLLLATKGLEPPMAIGAAVYHCQQAVEKVLKAYLIASGREFPRIHDLLRLVELCESLDPSFEQLRPQAEYLTPFASQTRYPEYGAFPTAGEARIALEYAQYAVHFVRSHLPEEVQP